MESNRRSIKDYIQISKTGVIALKHAFIASPKLAFIYVVSNLLSRLVLVAQIWLTKVIIDEVVLLTASANKDLTNIIIYLSAAFAVYAFRTVFLTISFMSFERLDQILSRYVQISLINKSLTLDMPYFEDPEFYNQFSRIKNSVESRLRSSMQDSAELIGLIFTFISIAFLLIYIHWSLIPLIIILNMPVLVWGMGFSLSTRNLSVSLSEEGRKADYLANLAVSKESIYEVKLFNLKDYLIKKYESFSDRLMADTWKITKPKFLGAGAMYLAVDLAYFVFWGWAILRTITGIFSIGQLVMYVQVFKEANGSISGMLRYINDLYEHILYIEDFDKFLKLESKIKDKEDALSLKKINSIKFENVWFRYKEDLPYVLEDVSFTVNENENIALVGQNGAGKTTIIKLLMRFFEPTDGRILINDLDIKEYKIADLHHNIGTVFQDFVKYQLTAEENIAFGQIEKVNNKDLIKDAGIKSGADEFINKLSNKYETILGSMFTGGSDLSVGQWQKVAIARAFVRDSSVMILDEPTAAIDAKSEYEIFKKFVDLVEGKITILISHRFSTVRLANKIIVIESGRVIEKGSHSDLMIQNGKYAEMFNLQAEGYK